MNTIKFALTILSVVFTTSLFASGNDNVYISGTYDGTVQHRVVHVEEGKQIEDLNNKSYGVKLTFNHDKFVYQDEKFAFSGTFEAIDGILYLNVQQVKGKATYDLSNRNITYDLKDNKLVLYSTSKTEDLENGQDIVILNLNKI